MKKWQLDFASIRLVPSNADSLLARLQAHEYRSAMLLRRIMPWLVSGACHAARSEVHHHVMSQHSLFFQGNDVEVGLLADRLGYRIGHIMFDVPTTVPSTTKAWLRQRLAWAGGEVRLFVANPQIALHHPFWWFYGAVVTIGGLPLRWEGLLVLGWAIVGVPATYMVLLLYLHRGHWNWPLLLMPFYSAFSSLVVTPIGLYYYVRMAVADRNMGLIRTHRVKVVDGDRFVAVVAQSAGTTAADQETWMVDPSLTRHDA
jgi:cellulose synthase/poly-beta-1,6-N-acetylglucosamine synthase-like glycosyltransferase